MLSEARLVDRFEVSRGTIRQALAALRAEGLIVGGRGRPPVVRSPTLTQSFDQMVSFSAWAERIGRQASARTLELARRPADAESAAQLELDPGTPVFEYTRVRLLDGDPIMIERTTWIERIGQLLLHCDLDGGSVYAQLSELGVEIAEAQQAIAAIAASTEQAGLLGVARRAPLLEVRRRALDPDGVPLEWSHDTYRGDTMSLTLQSEAALPRAGVTLRLVETRGSAAGC
jgi:GntR family transcriptional regulator